MKEYISVDVITEPDEFGNMLPKQILCSNKRRYNIQRIIQVCQPEDKVIRYTILVADKQRQLFFNGIDWRVSSPNRVKT